MYKKKPRDAISEKVTEVCKSEGLNWISSAKWYSLVGLVTRMLFTAKLICPSDFVYAGCFGNVWVCISKCFVDSIQLSKFYMWRLKSKEAHKYL